MLIYTSDLIHAHPDLQQDEQWDPVKVVVDEDPHGAGVEVEEVGDPDCLVVNGGGVESEAVNAGSRREGFQKRYRSEKKGGEDDASRRKGSSRRCSRRKGSRSGATTESQSYARVSMSAEMMSVQAKK